MRFFLHGYCPHGGALSVDPSTFEDIPPHRFCSRDSNQSYSVNTFGESYVRDSFISPTLGVPDDLGYSGVLDQIANSQDAVELLTLVPVRGSGHGQGFTIGDTPGKERRGSVPRRHSCATNGNSSGLKRLLRRREDPGRSL